MTVSLKGGLFHVKPDYKAVADALEKQGIVPAPSDLDSVIESALRDSDNAALIEKLGEGLSARVLAECAHMSERKEGGPCDELARGARETPSARNQRAREIAGEAGQGPKPDTRIRR